MKRLFLIRHAKSSWKNSLLRDIDRPLNQRGKRDAPFMGQRLKEMGAAPDLILTSPAKRAQTTANIIVGALELPLKDIITDNSIYGASVLELLNLIHSIQQKFNQVFIFGHNPEFTEFAGFLTDTEIDNIPTCGIFCIDFNIDSWKKVAEGRGKVVFFDYPKKHQ